MKKNDIYGGALFYLQEIQNRKLTLTLTRYFRDAFKDMFDNAISIQKDLDEIRAKFKDVEDKKEAEEEIKTLMEETIEVRKLPADVFLKLEMADIKVDKNGLDLIEKLADKAE